MENQAEVVVGKSSFESKGQSLVEKIWFRGERLGHCTSDPTLGIGRMNRRETIYSQL